MLTCHAEPVHDSGVLKQALEGLSLLLLVAVVAAHDDDLEEVVELSGDYGTA